MFHEFLKSINTFIAFNCAICRSRRKSAQCSIITFYHRKLKPNVLAAVSTAMTLIQCFTQRIRWLFGCWRQKWHARTYTHTISHRLILLLRTNMPKSWSTLFITTAITVSFTTHTFLRTLTIQLHVAMSLRFWEPNPAKKKSHHFRCVC
jgi:hypothetical protein